MVSVVMMRVSSSEVGYWCLHECACVYKCAYILHICVLCFLFADCFFWCDWLIKRKGLSIYEEFYSSKFLSCCFAYNYVRGFCNKIVAVPICLEQSLILFNMSCCVLYPCELITHETMMPHVPSGIWLGPWTKTNLWPGLTK